MNRSVGLLLVILLLLSTPLMAVLALSGSEQEITDNDDFFTLSIGPAPSIDVSKWNLTVDGLVERRLNLSYANVTHMVPRDVTATLKCVEGPSGTAVWTGVRVSDVLELAGVFDTAEEVVFHGADGYTSSLTLEDASGDDVLLALLMNGEVLPEEHGFPLRLVAPGKAGYKWVKWIERIEIIDYDYKGYWESRGWDDDADQTMFSEWGLHAVLLSVAFIVGGLSMVTGLRLSERDKLFRDLPRFMDRRFHRMISTLYLVLLFAIFGYWGWTTYELRGDLFYTPHGILGAFVVGMHAAGGVLGTERYIKTPSGRVFHRFLNRFAYLVYTGVMFVGLNQAYYSGIW